MKKSVFAAGAAVLLAAPAFATNVTVEFTRDDGSVRTAVFDDEAMMVTTEQGSAPYTLDPETRVLCSADEEGEVCITFSALPEEPTVGFTTDYETSRGFNGVAKITVVE